MNQNLGPLAPEIILAASAVAGLLAGSWLPRHRQWLIRALAAAACLAGLATAGLAATRPATADFGTSYAIDTATNTVRIIVLAATLLIIGLSASFIASHPRETEFYVLLQLAALGTIVLAGANDLLLLFAGYLLASVPGYALAGFAKDGPGTEAAMKYYLIGALLGVFMLTGITLLDGAGRTTSYPLLHAALAAAPHGTVTAGLIGVLAGLLFKAGAVPAQFWVPDVTDGTSAPVAAFVTTVPKIGAFAALLRLLTTAIPPAAVDWPLLAAVLAAATMTLGNLAAFYQTSVKRLLAYSTISQAGYLLMAIAVADRSALAVRSLLFYLAAYAVTNLGAFAVVTELPHAATLASYRGLARRHPGLAAVLVICLLGLVGTPPTAVFVGKLEIFTATIDGGYAWLAALAVANTIASLFYYLRWLAPAFLRQPAAGDAAGAGTAAGEPDALPTAGRWAAWTAYAAGAISLALGIAAGAVLPALGGTLLRLPRHPGRAARHPRSRLLNTLPGYGTVVTRYGEGGVYGYTPNKEDYLKRLRRIEGQVRGLQKMVEDDKYCIDILTQVSAATRALQSVALGLLEDHLGHCVAQAAAEGGEVADQKVREAADAIARLVKS